MRKTKLITALLTAFMITAVFLTPITAYANEDTEITVDNPDESGEDSITEGFDEPIDIVETSDIDIDEPPNESAVPDNSKPFTPDGQASVVDLAYESDGKMFYTFKTPAGNVFYLVIDRERGTDNVYFLNAVTEDDLLALAENSDKKGSTSAIPTIAPSTTEPDGTGNNPDNPNTETDNPPAKKSNTGMIIFIVIGVAAVGIAAYYIKVIRPKQQGDIDDEDDDIPDEDDSVIYDNGEEMQFEDEPDESDGEYEDSDDTDDNDEDSE